MDRSLLLLLKLRANAFGRRCKKTLSTPKGVVMAIVTALLLSPALISAIIAVFVDFKPPFEPIRRFAPLALFALTAISLLLSAGEQALYYSPAEVTFLFAGPYQKRHLLAYKLVTTALLSLFSAAFCSVMGGMFEPRYLSAFVGSFLIIFFLQAVQMVAGLAANTVGALAWSRGRRFAVLGLVVLAGLAVASVARELGGAGFLEALERVERSPVAAVVLAPFRWFVYATFAERIWPDLAIWSGLGLLVDLVLLGLIFVFDTSYLEAVASSSARRFAKLRRLGAGGGSVRSAGGRNMGRFGFRPPNPPWWGGVGPNFWRQMTNALGNPGRIIGLVLILSLVPFVLIFIAQKGPSQSEPLPYIGLGMVAYMSFVLSILIPYDFRGDVDVMESLKSLPIAPSRIALGQLMTPTLVSTVGQALAMLVVVVGLGGKPVVAWPFLAFLLPVNFLFFSIENLLFLWYPSRVVAGQFDVMAMGRQMLFLLAKFLGLASGVGLATGVGLAVYVLTGRSTVAALVASWLAMSASSMALVPLVGRAFRKFDVAGDIPA